MTATLHTADGRSTLRFERYLDHAIERVWRAVTEPEQLARWFPSEVIYQRKVGAPMQFDFGGDMGLDVMPGEVVAWDPPHSFAFRWGEDELRFELSGDDTATTLVFTHQFKHQPGKAARDAAGWEACLDAFSILLADGDAAGPTDVWRKFEAVYTRDFGALRLLGDGQSTGELHLTGPYAEVDGHPAVAVTLDGRPGVLVVREGELADGAPVEFRAGTVAEPGEVHTSGTLHDPAAAESRA